MKSSIIKSLVVAIAAVATLGSQSLQAQESNGWVGILDVALVFKSNISFEANMEAIRKDAEVLKAKITQQQEAIKTEAQGLNKFEVGTPRRNQLEGELEVKQANLRTLARQQETILLNREARVYYDTYRQMQTVVSSLAAKHGISLVLRFESEKINPDNRPEVIKGVNRSVVFYGNINLTDAVTKAMNEQRSAQVPAATQYK